MRRYLLFLLILSISYPACSQNHWKGEVSVNYGSDLNYAGVEGHKWYSSKSGAKASIGYYGKSFFIESGGDVNYKSHFSDVIGFTVKYKAQQDINFDASFTAKDVRNIQSGAFLKAGWNLSPSDKLKFDYNYGFGHDLVANSSLSILGADEKGASSADGGEENLDNTKVNHIASLDYSHQFLKPGRSLSVRYNLSFSDESKYSDWHTIRLEEGGSDGVGSEKRYRITPRMFDLVNLLKVTYAERNLGGIDRLDADFTLGFNHSTDKDYQRASTLVGTEWRDSTSYHEQFLFNALTVSPTAHMKYNAGVYGVDASYTPEFYSRRLSNDDYKGSFDYGFISHLVNIKNVLDFQSKHQLTLTYDRSVKRPDYIQICWFERAGPQYSNVSYAGNPELLPEAKHLLDFSYVFAYGRFSVKPVVGYEYKFRIIEQTYTEEKEGDDTRRVYTWINGGHSHINSGSLLISWKGMALQANLGGKINYFHGVANTGNVTLSFDYSLNGDVSYQWKTWKFLCRGKYDSKIIRSYTAKDEVINLDLRVDKKLGKFNVFIEALDIFDKPVQVTTVNADQTEERTEQFDYKNKLFQIGASFTF